MNWGFLEHEDREGKILYWSKEIFDLIIFLVSFVGLFAVAAMVVKFIDKTFF